MCAIVLTLVLAGAAVAAGLVRMSHFSDVLKEDQPWDAERLSRVDQLTVDLGQTIHLTTPEVEAMTPCAAGCLPRWADARSS